MICFVISESHRYTLADVVKDVRAPAITLLSYDQLIRSRRLKRATYVFTDFDRLPYSDLELAGRIYRQLKEAGVKVLNNPARVKLRYALLRTLHREGLNDFNVHPADEAWHPLRFPVYLRKMRGHGNPCTDLLHTREEVDSAVAREAAGGVPPEHLMIIEYAGEPIRPDLYRKLAAFRMGSVISPYLCGHDKQWLVKAGINGIAGQELYEDESRLVRDNPYAETLRKAFELAEIEYGRADYGFYQGRLQVFEINTNPHIPRPGPHPFATRVQTIVQVFENALTAMKTLDSEDGPDIQLPKDPLLDRHRKWKRVFFQTRPVS